MEYDANLRAVLGCYAIGTGPLDIGTTVSFLGLPGGRSFDRQFYRYSDIVNRKIIALSSEIIDEALCDEISLTISEKLKNKYNDDEIKVYVHNFLQTTAIFQMKYALLVLYAVTTWAGTKEELVRYIQVYQDMVS